VTRLRALLGHRALTPKPEYSMLGRTYALGHEPNLEDWLLHKPRRTAANPESPWAVWYPLRRKGEFSALSPDQQGPILSEHGKIGHAFGQAGFAQDIRLACFGLDRNDNDFVIGLVGRELYPLSACIQAMRKTQQTSRYIERMGPFFIGKAVWQRALQPQA
jgi:chlorite dismutase